MKERDSSNNGDNCMLRVLQPGLQRKGWWKAVHVRKKSLLFTRSSLGTTRTLVIQLSNLRYRSQVWGRKSIRINHFDAIPFCTGRWPCVCPSQSAWQQHLRLKHYIIPVLCHAASRQASWIFMAMGISQLYPKRMDHANRWHTVVMYLPIRSNA